MCLRLLFGKDYPSREDTSKYLKWKLKLLILDISSLLTALLISHNAWENYHKTTLSEVGKCTLLCILPGKNLQISIFQISVIPILSSYFSSLVPLIMIIFLEHHFLNKRLEMDSFKYN